MTRFEAYAHSYGKQVGHARGVHPARRGAAGVPVALVPVLRNRPDSPLGRLALLLVHALGEHRYEPWNSYNPHRAYPSARAGFTVDAAVRVGDRRWVFDPVAIALRGETPYDGDGPVEIELSLRPERLPDAYGPLRDALAELEAGHVAATVVAAARALGGAARYEPAAGGSAVVGAVVLDALPVGVVSPSALRLLHRRSSGVAPFGLAAGARRMSTTDLEVLAAAAPAGLPTAPELREHALLGPGNDLRPGRYEVGAGWRLADQGASVDDVQAAFSYPPADVDVASMPLVWMLTGDVAAAAERPDGYRQLLVAAGAAAQHRCLAAAARGLFCRPCRSVDEARLESRLGLPAAESLLYLLLVGAPRVHDFWFDLLPSLEALS